MSDRIPFVDTRAHANDRRPITDSAAPPGAMRDLVRSGRSTAANSEDAAASVRDLRATSAAHVAREVGARLWERTGTPMQAALRGLLSRDVGHYYAPSVLQPVDAFLLDVVEGGSRFFLQSAMAGAGSSTLALDYTRAYNVDAQAREARERVFYVRFERGTNSVTKFYDTVCLATGAPLTNQEIRHRSPAYFALRVLAAAVSKGARAIVLDHVRELPPHVRGCVATLLRLTDPNYAAGPDEQAFAEVRGRIGVAVVDRIPPEALFRNYPEVLLLLENRHHVLSPYRALEDIAEAIRQADIGLRDFDMSNPDDAEIAWVVQDRTSGLPAQMTPLFQLIEKVSRLSGGARPTPKLVETALPFYRNLVDVLWAKKPVDPAAPADAEPDRLYGVYAADVVRLPEKLSDAQRRKLIALAARENSHANDGKEEKGDERHSDKRRAEPTAAMKKGRSALLRNRREARHLAASEGAAMRRKGHVNVDYGDERTP